MRAFLKRFDEILSKLDELDGGEELDELCAEMEDAIFLLECAGDEEEEILGALEELGGLAEELRDLGQRERADELAAAVELARRNFRPSPPGPGT